MNSTAPKAWKGKGMDGWIARWYARTRHNDMEHFRSEASCVAARLPGGCMVLEVAPGPGFFAVELARLGDFKITGLDISRTFVEIATKHARNAGLSIDFRFGNASAMPFADESFDFVYCSAAFKNFSEPVKALDEMHRVLHRGGEALIVDLCKDTPLHEIDAYVKQSGRGPVDAWLTNWTFRHMLLKRAYTRQEFVQMAERSRFGACRITAAPLSTEVRLTKSANGSVAAA
ncbi:MAG TPA: class I SAM-dependent methyltransferase [Candidatus Angelobacter sp.]|nr:class I SAM-dependent methyltransferase [Candidatus Angelobacter sp.]